MTKNQPDIRLDLSGAQAIMEARNSLAASGAGDIPPLNLSIYKSISYEALGYLEKQLGEFELTLAMFHDTHCQPIRRTSDEDQSGVQK